MITFLNDKTLGFDVYFMPDKAGPTVLGSLKLFLNQVEHGDCRCTRLRSDCGTEYDNYDIYANRLFKGTTWKGTVPGNPQMNGKPERLGQTIQQKASAMLKKVSCRRSTGRSSFGHPITFVICSQSRVETSPPTRPVRVIHRIYPIFE